MSELSVPLFGSNQPRFHFTLVACAARRLIEVIKDRFPVEELGWPAEPDYRLDALACWNEVRQAFAIFNAHIEQADQDSLASATNSPRALVAWRAIVASRQALREHYHFGQSNPQPVPSDPPPIPAVILTDLEVAANKLEQAIKPGPLTEAMEEIERTAFGNALARAAQDQHMGPHHDQEVPGQADERESVVPQASARTAPAAADTTQGDIPAASPPRNVNDLEPAVRRAYFAFVYAEQQVGRRLTDREAHEWLMEHGIPIDAEGLADYKLPSFSTFERNCREARAALGERKYTRRAGRPRSRSIVTEDQIEPPRSED